MSYPYSAEPIKPLQIDFLEAARFVTMLAGGDPVSFQTFSEVDGRRDLARIMHGTLDQHREVLQRLNQSGAGVFVMVNAGDGLGRKGGNVVRVRALFADLDGAPLEPVLAVPLRPHLVIESSPCRYHAYWLVNDCPLDRFASLQSAVAARFDSDPSVKDLPRVMRVPGFWHQKRVPFQTRVHSSTVTPPYTISQVVAGLGLVENAAKCRSTEFAPPGPSGRGPVNCSGGILSGSRNATLTSLAGSMRHRGMGLDAIYVALKEENIVRCVPPLDDSEVRSIARSVSRYEPGEGAEGYTRAGRKPTAC